jgi:UDP-glucose 4-epimerase
VGDLAEAHVLALDALVAGAASAAYNVGTGTGHSVLEVLRATEEVTGKKAPYAMGPRREGDPPVLVANADRLMGTFGWKPRFTDLREIVATAWEFEKRRDS